MAEVMRILVLAALPSLAFSQTISQFEIENVGFVDYRVGTEDYQDTDNAILSVRSAERTPSLITFYRYAPTLSGAFSPFVGTTAFQDGPGGPLTPLSPPSNFGNPIPVDQAVPLLDVEAYQTGQPIFLTLRDLDQNLIPGQRESVLVTLTVAATGDTETLRLIETEPDSGIFAGYIPSVGASATEFDGALSIETGARIVADYVDIVDGTDTTQDAALVDPFGIVFDSSNGNPVNGATVTLIDVATGNPATVFGDDGVSSYPSTVETGSTFTEGGITYTMPAGGYRFPLIAPGDYRLEVTPPIGSGFTFISTVSIPDLQLLPGAPFELDPDASFGETFTVTLGPAVEIDIPIDPSAAPVADGLFLQKSAALDRVAIGDFLRYDLVLENTGGSTITNLELEDRLPRGFRYQSGSAYLENQKIANPQISGDGRTLSFTGLGDIDAGESFNLRYVVEVTAGAPLGRAVNSAVLEGDGERSNEARAIVTVLDDLAGENLLIGRVMIRPTDRDLWTKDDQTIGLPGLEGARIYLEDGTYVITDEEGRFHFEGVTPGAHVVQLDELSVPERFEIVGIENTRFAGRDYSQFVDLQAGAMWRTDFFVVEKAPEVGTLRAKLCHESGEGGVIAKLDLNSDKLSGSGLRAIFLLPGGLSPAGSTATLGDREFPVSLMGQSATVVVGDFEENLSGTLELALTGRAAADSQLGAMLYATSAAGDKLRPPRLAVALTGAQGCGEEIAVESEIPWETEPHFADFGDKLDEPEIDYNAAWLDRAAPTLDWVEPRSDFVAAIPAIAMSIKYPADHDLQIFFKEERVSGLYLTDSIVGSKGETAMKSWRGMNLDLGDNIFTAVLLDKEGNEVERKERNFFYSGPPVKAEFVLEESRLIADGRTQPLIALRLTDASGKPVRPGLRGEYRVDPPYQALERNERRNRFLEVGEAASPIRYQVGQNGIAYLPLEPTSQSGEVTVRLNLDEREFDFQAWLKPVPRDWILVGLGDVTVGYNDLSDKIEDLPEDEVAEDLYDESRVAFFAKGRVKGEWLLTVAYDTDKESEVRGQESLHQVIDPDTYYTLYADETEQGYEAASAEKLYVKLEREKFFAVFGDFDTGLVATELSRYNRSLTGLQTRYEGENVTFNGFVSETDFTFVRDEIRGDGTSGLYRLSKKDIVINSETIIIQTRDRFQSELIIEERTLARHLDYNINYDDSSIYFKRPVYSRDENLNPIFIIAEYEVEGAEESYNYGGRASIKTADDRVELGGTYVHEQTSESEGDLYGADFTMKVGEHNELRAEVATTDKDSDSDPTQAGEGDAYLVELEHRSERLEGLVYYRQQDEEFGLGQQNVSESGTRKYGIEGRYRIGEDLDAVVNAFHQELLDTGDTRNVFEVAIERKWKDSVLRAGYIWAEDDTAAQGKLSSDQLHFGVSQFLLQDKLVLRADHYQSLGNSGDNIDYPTRTILGADYFLTERLRLFSEYEMTFGEEQDTQNARLGFATQPWTGASIDTSIAQSLEEDGGRTWANFGLSQRLQLSEHWSFDGGVDSARNFNESLAATPFNPRGTNASGSTTSEDFTAYSVSSTYQEKEWSWTSRFEQRFAETEDRWSIYSGIVGEVDKGLHMGLQATVFRTDADGGESSTNADIRYSIAYRPLDSEWIILNRFELLYDSISGSSSLGTESFRIVNRGDINYLPHEDLQIAFQYGHKYVLTTIEDDQFTGFTHFYGVETRYDIHERVDIGVRGSVRHSWNSGVFDYSFGPSIGISPATNLWVSVGYNVVGFYDEDFSRGNYTAQGPYVQFRFKFDQHTLDDLGQLIQRSR